MPSPSSSSPPRHSQAGLAASPGGLTSGVRYDPVAAAFKLQSRLAGDIDYIEQPSSDLLPHGWLTGRKRFHGGDRT